MHVTRRGVSTPARQNVETSDWIFQRRISTRQQQIARQLGLALVLGRVTQCDHQHLEAAEPPTARMMYRHVQRA